MITSRPTRSLGLPCDSYSPGWTGYAVGTTCVANRTVKRAVFGDAAFAFVYVLIAGTVAMGAWTLVNVARL